MRDSSHSMLFLLLTLILAACGGAEVAVVEEAPAPILDKEAAAEEGNNAASTFVIEVPIPDIPAGAEMETSGLDDMVADFILPNYAGISLLSVAWADGALIFEFEGQYSSALCADLFQTFDSPMDCDGASMSAASEGQAAEQQGEAETTSPASALDAEKMAAAVEATLDSVVVIITEDSGATGFIYSPDGYILTNRHVVAGRSSFEVVLFDGRSFSASLVGHVQEPDAALGDLAVLKIEASDLPALEFGDSDSLSAGEPVFAVGHPGDYGYWLATAGVYQEHNGLNIVTSIPGSEGASGAPMLNQDGEVVGLLFGEQTLGSLERPVPTPFDINVVIWTYDEFQSLRTHSTWGVAANEARALADAIIARGSNVPSHTAYGASTYLLEGSALTVETPGMMGPEIVDFLNEYYLSGIPGIEVAEITNEAGSATIHFNQEPPQEAIEAVLGMLAESQSGANLDINVSIPDAIYQDFSQPADDAQALAAAEASLAGVVAISSDSGGGTGFFISEDGYILTNAHVVDEVAPGGFLEVTLYDGRSFSAALVGYDEDQSPDVGVLKIDINDAYVLPIANSSSLSEGETVFQIGHPGGYGYWLITGGEVLRIRGADGQFDNSAASASGNSGGPIFNLNGEVVGLLFGREGGEVTREHTRTTTEIIENWSAFWALREQFTSGVLIDEALNTASQIISAKGNVP